MGNWRTVNMKGHVGASEVKAIREYLSCDSDEVFYLAFGCGVYGLSDWVKPDGNIDVSGNVGERDCNNSDLFEELSFLAEKFPTLDAIVHLGDDWSSLDCVASFIVKNGKCEWAKPMVKELRPIPDYGNGKGY